MVPVCTVLLSLKHCRIFIDQAHPVSCFGGYYSGFRSTDCCPKSKGCPPVHSLQELLLLLHYSAPPCLTLLLTSSPSSADLHNTPLKKSQILFLYPLQQLSGLHNQNEDALSMWIHRDPPNLDTKGNTVH